MPIELLYSEIYGHIGSHIKSMELYFVRYEISKFKDFYRNFWGFFMIFLAFLFKIFLIFKKNFTLKIPLNL